MGCQLSEPKPQDPFLDCQGKPHSDEWLEDWKQDMIEKENYEMAGKILQEQKRRCNKKQ